MLRTGPRWRGPLAPCVAHLPPLCSGRSWRRASSRGFGGRVATLRATPPPIAYARPQLLSKAVSRRPSPGAWLASHRLASVVGPRGDFVGWRTETAATTTAPRYRFGAVEVAESPRGRARRPLAPCVARLPPPCALRS